jgi:hypothetical protein
MMNDEARHPATSFIILHYLTSLNEFLKNTSNMVLSFKIGTNIFAVKY